ncbi:pectate lyase-like adhesive domain-containing protein, partial [Lactobacillus sp. M0396]|uniref:pectate lyase-like adhesive domain-containing protein n=1 Tax=Lactobacillus sp. M0396 TaxID=2751030 RepID=UPI0018DDEB21
SFFKSDGSHSEVLNETAPTKDHKNDSDKSNSTKKPEENSQVVEESKLENTDSSGKGSNSDITQEGNAPSDGNSPEDSHFNDNESGDNPVFADQSTSKVNNTTSTAIKSILTKDTFYGLSYDVYTWEDFKDALNNKTIAEIVLKNNIIAPKNNGNDTFDVPGRTLLIRSDGISKFTLNFTGFAPKQTGGTNAEVTYQNLNIISGDYYGVWNTDNVNGNFHSNIIFKDCSFNGSQLIYAGNNTHIYFTGNNEVRTAKWPNRNDQQMFEFTDGKKNDSIDFLDGNFLGSTYGGTIIEMKGNTNSVTIHKGATVTLNPVEDFDGGGDTGEWGYPYSAIYMKGSGNVIVSGILNINIGENKVRPYEGTRNAGKARAVYLSEAGSTFNISQNGQVNIRTNGNITNRDTGNLFYDNGNLTINPNSELNIFGDNMGDYSGTLVYVTGSADVENGSFNIALGSNAGTGAITLLDVKGGTFKINNPNSFILDAHNNKNPATSIIGNNKITITNIRQQLQTAAGHKFTLPPFHVLEMQKSGTGVVVNTIEMLDGNKSLTQKQLDEIKNDPALSEIINDKRFTSFLNIAQAAVNNSEQNKLDNIVKSSLEDALSRKDSESYNNVSFVPANPDGFLDIDDDSLEVINNVDGSRTVKGKVKNYTEEVDGPSTDNVFYKYFPKGTKGYIIVKYISNNPKYNGIIQEDKGLKPYVNTNDSYRGSLSNRISELPSVFTSEINTDGTFSVTIPADVILNMAKGDKVEITPDANFVEYNPIVVNAGSRPIVKSLNILTLSEAQDEAAEVIKEAVQDAKDKKPSNLKDDQSKAFDNELIKALAMSDPVNESNKDTTVYGAETINEVNKRKNIALDIIKAALETANKESDDLNKFDAAKDTAKQALKNELDGNGTSGVPGIINQIADLADTGLTPDHVKKYQDQAMSAYEKAIAAVDSSDSYDALNSAREAGIKSIDQALIDAKDQQVKDKAISDLKAAQTEALKILADKKATVENNINSLGNVSAAGKTEFNKEVEKFYNSAVSNVNNPTPATIAQVNNEKNIGIQNIDSVSSKAQALNKEIEFDQKKLNDYAQAAVDRINKTDMSDEDKQTAVDKISKARDDAKLNVGNQITIEDADKAEIAGEDAIKAVETEANAADLESFKNSYIDNVNVAAEKAIESVNTAFNNLKESGEQEKAATDKAIAIRAINNAKDTANNAIKAAMSKKEVVNAFDNAKEKFDGSVKSVEVAFAKIAATDAIQNAADKVSSTLSKDSDKKKVQIIVSQANDDLKTVDTIIEVNSIRDQAIKDINDVKASADAAEKAELEANKTAQKLNTSSMAEAAKKRIQNAYDKLSSSVQNDLKD